MIFAPSNGDLYWNSWLTISNSIYFEPQELKFDRADFENRMALLATQSERRSQELLALPDGDPIAFLRALANKLLSDSRLRRLVVSDATHTRAWLNQLEVACEAANFRLSSGGSEHLIRLLRSYGLQNLENIRDERAFSKTASSARWDAERLVKLCKELLSVVNFDGEQGGK